MIIIGNGKSVRVEDLNNASTCPCLAVNRFHLSYDFHHLRPKATFCIDPQVIDNHINDIQANCINPLYVPKQFFWRVFKKIGFKSKSIQFFPFDRGDKPLRFSSNFSLFSGNGASVIFTAIQYAASQKVTDIYLYGIDHNFEINVLDDNGMVIDQGEDNHFIEGYRKFGEKWFPPDTIRIENAFMLARRECDALGIKIWNATRGGSLEVFDRINFDVACNRMKKNIDHYEKI